MKTPNGYVPEYLLLAVVMLLTVSGFWNIYVGPGAAPDPYQNLHLVTNAIWLGFLLYQLSLIAKADHKRHRKAGLAVLVLGPLVFATTAMLSVHSARKGVVSGEGDFLIVQNVGVTLELGLLILLAFIVRKRRKLHGSFMLSTAILFLGIASFFTLTSFVPGFVVTGPDTFDRFAKSAITGQAMCLVVGILFVIRDRRNGWPVLLAALFFFLNEFVRSFLDKRELIEPLTEVVGAMSKPLTFVCAFALLTAMLATTGILRTRGAS